MGRDRGRAVLEGVRKGSGVHSEPRSRLSGRRDWTGGLRAEMGSQGPKITYLPRSKFKVLFKEKTRHRQRSCSS